MSGVAWDGVGCKVTQKTQNRKTKSAKIGNVLFTMCFLHFGDFCDFFAIFALHPNSYQRAPKVLRSS
jgi:hypothetical protein